MSADEELGYVYLPTGTPTNDFYGGDRPRRQPVRGIDRLCRRRDGRTVWHFQTVHHGLWDYDNPCAPNLVDITVDGKAIKAVAQITKQGYCFVFDRVTGEPVWPIEECDVPPRPCPAKSRRLRNPYRPSPNRSNTKASRSTT